MIQSQNIANWEQLSFGINKSASIINQKLPLLKENELQVQKYTWAIISTLEQNIV